MSYVIETPEGRREYENRLLELESGVFQWTFTLSRLDGEFVTNRDWHRVGPEFETRGQGAKYLGWESGSHFVGGEGARKHRNELISEYDSLFTDPVDTQKQMGRPSQGREKRLQATVTSEQMAWLEAQKGHYETNSVSDVVFHLIEELMR